MDERLKFIARLLDGEKMAALCRDFGISRKTGYKIHGYSKRGRRFTLSSSFRLTHHASRSAACGPISANERIATRPDLHDKSLIPPLSGRTTPARGFIGERDCEVAHTCLALSSPMFEIAKWALVPGGEHATATS